MDTYKKELVSVIIPTYKQSNLLSRAIKSVLKQTYSKIELLVVNDNETDDEYTEKVKEVVGQFDDKRLKLVFQEKHINGAAARNAGIRASKGEYVAFLDDDDFWNHQKIEKQVALLSVLDETWGGVTCKNMALKDEEVFRALPPFKENNMCENILLRRTEISTDCIMLRRTALDRTGYFDEKLQRNQEVQLLTFFTSKYKIKLLDEYLVYVDSTSSPNQPSPIRMEQIKKDYFASVKSIMDQFSNRVQKRIFIMHRFEIGLLMVRNGMKKDGILRCISIFRSPYTLFYAFEYVNRKLKASRLAKDIDYSDVNQERDMYE